MKNNMKDLKKGKMTAKQACDIAINYFWELLGVRIEIQVEETAMDIDGKNWLITMSYTEQDKSVSLIYSKKLYKIFKINASTGQVISMKIRKI